MNNQKINKGGKKIMNKNKTMVLIGKDKNTKNFVYYVSDYTTKQNAKKDLYYNGISCYKVLTISELINLQDMKQSHYNDDYMKLLSINQDLPDYIMQVVLYDFMYNNDKFQLNFIDKKIIDNFIKLFKV